MSAPPRTSIASHDEPGGALLVFTARPADGGAAVVRTEYRIGGGEWREAAAGHQDGAGRSGSEAGAAGADVGAPGAEARADGDLVTRAVVPRRGTSARVFYRSVDAAGRVEPERRWTRNWPGLAAVAFPPGSDQWVATHDWWRFAHGLWHLDHPVCLLFTCEDPRRRIDVARVEQALRGLGFSDRLSRLAHRFGGGTTGGLALGEGGRRDPSQPRTTTPGLKRGLRPWSLQSAIHVRAYAPGQDAFDDGRRGSWVVASAHVDANELMWGHGGRLRRGAKLPRGAPDPGLAAFYLKYGGNSEWAEQRVADLWADRFGSTCVARGAAPFGEAQDWFEVEQQGCACGRRWVTGKWWRSDGRATVLLLPR